MIAEELGEFMSTAGVVDVTGVVSHPAQRRDSLTARIWDLQIISHEGEIHVFIHMKIYH